MVQQHESEESHMNITPNIGIRICGTGSSVPAKTVTNDDMATIVETSDDRVRMEFTKWAVSQVGVQTGDQPAADKKKKEEKKEEAPAVEAPKAEEAPAETAEEKKD